MTQPTSLTKTFDTSLIDVQQSFSSTETNTSGSSGKENMRPIDEQASGRSSSPYKTVPTEQLYEQWAATYDTDGNVLQACDDVQLVRLVPEFVRLTLARRREGERLRVLDLGCGTGRNTTKLLQTDWGADAEVDIVGWDGSRAMLDIAQAKCEAVERQVKVRFELGVRDLLSAEAVPDSYANSFDGLISTLVLEHIPADAFFGVVHKVLKSGAYALITNMHQDLGALSRAGYKTASGERFKATSYIYTPQEVVSAAKEAGLELVGEVGEMAVDSKLIDGGVVDGVEIRQGFVTERARKYVGVKVWFGIVFRKP